jgi:hypothetical protein
MPAMKAVPVESVWRVAVSFMAVAALAWLTACSNVETHTVNIQIAATGTKIEAKQVVALVYAQAPDAEIDKLLYSGGDLTSAIKRLRDRFPRLKPLLDEGAIGNTASGFVALHDMSRRAELRDLLWDENRDRAFLHNQASAAVGHGGDDLNAWLPYASYTFGSEWIAQGQPGWWWMDDQRQWQRK